MRLYKNAAASAQWIQLSFGVELLCKPCLTWHVEAATVAGHQKAEQLRDGFSTAEELGFAATFTEKDFQNEALKRGLAKQLMATELASMLLEDWKGIEDADTGEKPPINLQTCAGLMAQPLMASQFLSKMMESTASHQSEKKD